jgi:thiol-disulfide isomerase/thioredoxin
MVRKFLNLARPYYAILAAFLAVTSCLHAADSLATLKLNEPTDPRARKTYANAIDWLKNRNYNSAVDNFRKANKQDGGHCTECLRRAYEIATRNIGDYKLAEAVAREMLDSASTPAEKALAHFQIGMATQRQGLTAKKDQDKYFQESCDEFKAALEAQPQWAATHFTLGNSLAHLHQDDAARQEFSAFLSEDKNDVVLHERAQRYLKNIDLARATMAPAFTLVTIDGQHVSLDGLAGKVVLIDFWATWCGPCREALPHIKKIAERFHDQPLAILSVSLDTNDAKWRDFVAKNGMTWLQYRDNGSIARLFNVHAIPATFSIDADGVLEDQHVGDANIESRLRKMIAHAAETDSRKSVIASTTTPGVDAQ